VLSCTAPLPNPPQQKLGREQNLRSLIHPHLA
jgi:hypothetical protein